MATNFVQHGSVLTVVAAAAVVSGDLQIVEDAFGVAATSAETGEEYELEIGGVWELPKSTGASTGGNALAAVYWDAAAKKVTADDNGGANAKIGVFASTAADGAETAIVRLNSNF